MKKSFLAIVLAGGLAATIGCGSRHNDQGDADRSRIPGASDTTGTTGTPTGTGTAVGNGSTVAGSGAVGGAGDMGSAGTTGSNTNRRHSRGTTGGHQPGQ